MKKTKRMKAFALGFILILGITVLSFQTESKADAGWITCTVQSVGPGGGSVLIGLTDVNGSFTLKWCYLNASQANQLLAVALTAMSLGKNVNVYMDPSTTNPIVQYIMMNNY